MKNKILLLTIFTLVLQLLNFTNNVKAQGVSAYSFTSSVGNYVSLSGSAATILNQAPTNADDQVFAPVSLGFSFPYHGATFTNISLSPNCYAVFGGSTSVGYVPLTTDPNCIAVMASNMMATTTGHVLRYTTTGSTGSQIFTAEWYNWGHSANGLNEVNIELKLYEATGAIQIIYQPTTPASSFQCEVGLSGATVSDFNNRTTTSSWSSSIAGTSNSAAMYFSGPNQLYPSNGLTYTWLPPSTSCSGTPTAGQASISANQICVGVSYTISLTGASTGTGITYQWQSSPNGSTWTNIAGATSPTYTTTASAGGVIYYRCILTCTASGQSATSGTAQLYIISGPTVTITPAGNQTICPGQSITLTANGATTYQWSNQATTSSITVSAAGYYTVTGTNTSGCSATSAPVIVTVSACATPTGLTTTNIGQHSAVIHWSSLTCAYAYQIYYRASQYTNWQYVNVTAGNNSYTLQNLQSNYYVQWKIRTICSSNSMSAWSATQTFHTLPRIEGNEPTATTDDLKISAYPNPTDATVTIQLNIFSDESTVLVSNILGQTVQQGIYNTGETNGEIKLNLGELPQGIYMVFVNDAQGSRSIRILKN